MIAYLKVMLTPKRANPRSSRISGRGIRTRSPRRHAPSSFEECSLTKDVVSGTSSKCQVGHPSQEDLALDLEIHLVAEVHAHMDFRTKQA